VSQLLSFLVLGLATGAVYVALATGVLTVFKASRVVNFAQGAMAMWGAYVYVEARTTGDVVLPVGSVPLGAPATAGTAILLGITNGLLMCLVIYVLVFRPLRHAPSLAQVVASVGVLITMQALVILRFGSESVNAPPILSTGTVTLFGASLSIAALLLAGIAVLLTGVIGAYLQYTKYGIATRAASEDEQSAVLTGYSTTRLAVIAWAFSATFSTVMVILASATTGLNSFNYTLYVIPALGAVLVARFSSMTVTTVAGLAIGAFQGGILLLSTKSWWPDWASPAGVSSTLPFVVIVIALFAFGDKLPRRGAIIDRSLPRIDLPRFRPVGLSVGCVVYLVLVLTLGGTYRFGLITTLILGLICFSYVVVTGYLGQVSLAQIAFAGVAGFTLSKLTTSWGFPFPLDLLSAAFVAGGVGLLVAIPAVRIRGTELAIVTLAAAAVIESFVFNNAALTGERGSPIEQPNLFGLDLAIRAGSDVARPSFAVLVLVIAIAVGLLLVRVLSGSTGKAFLAVRSNERAAAAAGLNVALIKAVGFGMSAFIAGIGGCLLGYSRGQLSVASFTVFVGISLLAFAYLGGITSLTGAVIAGLLGPLGFVYTFMDAELALGQYYGLISGLGLLLTVILNPTGIAGAIHDTRDGLRRPARAPASTETVGSSPTKTPLAEQEALRA